jgi:hypothetical protein
MGENLKNPTGTTMVLGNIFLENYYVIFDASTDTFAAN